LTKTQKRYDQKLSKEHSKSIKKYSRTRKTPV